MNLLDYFVHDINRLRCLCDALYFSSITSTALQWYMIAGTTPKSHIRSRPICHIPIIIRPDANFWHRPLISAQSEIKEQRNRINCMRIISRKVHLSKTIHDWLRPLRIVPYHAIIYTFFSKRAQMTVTWSNFVNNSLIASRQAYRRSMYCLQNWTRQP